MPLRKLIVLVATAAAVAACSADSLTGPESAREGTRQTQPRYMGGDGTGMLGGGGRA
jgi:hypothetical protein